ncbi:MAG: DUF488 domain-containing protein [Candidatus Brocadia sp.]|nr:DUF488 domain-containing protein [Candidatus Brocadia sp.]
MKKDAPETSSDVLTIGHSTHTLDAFIKLLQTHNVNHIVDVRTIPRSRRNPQFNREALPDSLKAVSIRYTHMAGLGGLRRTRADSPNTGWRNASFRGFADYMQTRGFEKSLQTLIELARHDRIALMCAEVLPWRCHRSLIADALLVRKIQVEHITDKKQRKSHKLTPWAVVNGTRIIYPPESVQPGMEAGNEC